MSHLTPRTICKNGVSLSVQASEYHYCTPRNNVGPYFTKEVGYIEKDGETFCPPEEWRQYSDGYEFPNEVYGYVPVELIEKFIADNGGICAN